LYANTTTASSLIASQIIPSSRSKSLLWTINTTKK
jgi:hypothetical protein